MIPTSTNNGYNTMHYDMAELKDLDIEQFGKTTFGNYTIKVEPDDNSESPREWDNLGTMVCWGGYGHLGDVNGGKEYGEFSSQSNFWIELAGIDDEGQELNMEKVIELAHKRNVILPVYIYDHSGITINTTGYSCPWDAGQLGFIYISLEKVRNEFSCKRVSKKMREKIETYLTNEVKTYDDYLTGNVYGFTIEREDPDGEMVDVDACWGYLGDPEDYMYNEIKGHIKYDIEHTPQQGELVLN